MENDPRPWKSDGPGLYVGSLCAMRWLRAPTGEQAVEIEHVFFFCTANSLIEADVRASLHAAKQWPSADGWENHGVTVDRLSIEQNEAGNWIIPGPEKLNDLDELYGK